MPIIDRGTALVMCPFCKRTDFNAFTRRFCTDCGTLICSECDERPADRTGAHEREDHLFPELEGIADDPDSIADDSKVDPGQTSN